MAPKPAPKPVGQAAWMNHVFGGEFHRAPKPPTRPTPAARGAQTRARNAARARAAAVPDYTPEMQGSGDTRARRRTVSAPSNKPPTMNRAAVLSGGRASGTAGSVPRPRPVVRIPTIAEGGVNLAGRATTAAPSAASKGGGILSKVISAAKVSLPKVVGGVAGGVGFLAAADKAGAASDNPGSYETLAKQSPSRARDYLDFQQRRAKAEGRETFDVSPAVYKMSLKNKNPRLNQSGPGIIVGKPQRRPNPAATKAPAVPKPKDGAFLRNAKGYNTLASTLYQSPFGDRSLTSSPGQYERAVNKFKQTHAWARNANTAHEKRNVHQAVQYLARTQHKRYFA